MYKLICEDCLNILPKIKGGSIDMVLCDLPYGITPCEWDKMLSLDKLWQEYKRVCKENAAIVLFAKEPFTSHLIISNLPMYRQKLTWLKTRPTNVFNAKKQFMNWTEDIVVFYSKLPTFNPQMRTDGQFTSRKVQRMNTDRSEGVLGSTGEKKNYVHEGNNGLFYPKTVLEYSNVPKSGENYHPTQKPVDLLEYLILTYTNAEDVVLDNCMGSGSTGVACLNVSRNFIGIEKEEKYFRVAQERVKALYV